MSSEFVSWCRSLHLGTTARQHRLRIVLLVVDLLILAYFVVTTFLSMNPVLLALDYLIAAWLILELMTRVVAERDRVGFATQPITLLDIGIIISLLLPAWFGNMAFLRVIRALRLVRSYAITRQMRAYSGFFRHNEEAIFSAINLIVFIFVVTAVVYVLQAESNDRINNYIDALYFTITTLTTTGFGDITLEGSTGRLLAVIIMIVGVALFIRLVQAIFRPAKVRYECPTCGLMRHETDAVHCKHCGQELHIPTEGAD